MKNQITQNIKVVVLSLILVSGISYVFAGSWTTPPSTPPYGNVDAPINVGSSTQYKIGFLQINASPDVVPATTNAGWAFMVPNASSFFHSISVANNIISNGKIGIGTYSPTVKLDVVGGDAKISGKTTTGTIAITGGSPAVGKVLTSDANGNASWQTSSGSVGTAQTIRWDKWVQYSVEIDLGSAQASTWVELVRHFNGCNNGWMQKDTYNSVRKIIPGTADQTPRFFAVSRTTCVRVDPTYAGSVIPNFVFPNPNQATVSILSTSADPYGP